MQIAPNKHLHVEIFNGKNHGKTLNFSLGPFSKQMDKYNFLNLKSNEIAKLCIKPRNEVKLANFTLHF